MYGLIRYVMLGGGGLAIIYALLNLSNFIPNGLVGIVVAAALFYISQFVQPPEKQEAPPPDIEMSTTSARELAESRRQRRLNIERAAAEKDGESGDAEAGEDDKKES